MFLAFSCFLVSNANGQDEALPIETISDRLPKESLNSKYRIIISQSDELEGMRKQSRNFTAKYKKNAYIVRINGSIQLHTGDYPEKRYAKQNLSFLKNYFRSARIVKSVNDSIIEFSLYEKKKPAKVNPIQINAELLAKESAKNQIDTVPGQMSDWDDEKYLAANTAKNEIYLTDQEKRVYYFMNLVRMNPKLFADTYLKDLKNSTDYYESSLYRLLQKLQPMQILTPNIKLFESAKCHAVESGASGYMGHKRVKCVASFGAECILYGTNEPVEVIITLLIDHGVKSLGHRAIILTPNYSELGVSIQPHKGGAFNSVLDFG